MKAKYWAINLFGVALWLYLVIFSWYIPFALKNKYGLYLILVMLAGGILLFLFSAEIGVENHLTFFHSDTNELLKPGLYPLASLAPFARDIRLTLGFGITKTINGIRMSREQLIRHFRDQRQVEYGVQVRTDSFLKADTHRFFNNFVWNFLFDFYGDYDEIQYYRVGRTVIFFTILATYACNIVFPASLLSEAVKYQSGSQEQAVEIKVNVAKIPNIPVPSIKDFEPLPEGSTQFYKTIETRKYLLYSEVPGGLQRGFKIEGNDCVVIPTGRSVTILTLRPPVYVINMEDTLWYSKPSRAFGLVETLIKKAKYHDVPDSKIRWSTQWRDLDSNWNILLTSSGIEVTALSPHDLPKDSVSGGLVCF